MINALNPRSAGLPPALEVDGETYRGKKILEKVVEYYNERGKVDNPLYTDGFWNSYIEECRVLVNQTQVAQATLEPLDLAELKEIIDSFPNGKASDLDGLSHDLLKMVSDDNLVKIMELMNEIIATGNFQLPEILKSRFSLLYKGHNKSRLNIDNYQQNI